MSILNKILSWGKKKEVIIEGGMEMLARLVSPEMGGKSFLEQYKKSLYVYACISKISEKVSSVEWKMYRIMNSDGDTEEIATHPALNLLYKPNPFQTKKEFLDTTIINLKTTGDAFWFKVRNSAGQVAELWNLRPDKVTIVADPVNFIREYRFDKGNGKYAVFAPEDIMHHKYVDPLSAYTGMSPLMPAQVRVQTEGFATQYQRDFFLNSARPDAIIKNAGAKMTKEQKSDLREDWTKKYGGVGKSSKIAILGGGLEYQQISISQRDMDYIEGTKLTRDDILIAFKMPKSVIGITEDVNRANAETGMYIFLSENIEPEMKRLEEKINEELISPDFGEEFYMGHVDPTPANREMVLKEYESGISNNYLLINEVRQREGLEPVNGGWSFYMSLISQPMGGLSQAGKKDLIKFILDDSDKTYKSLMAAKKPKRFDFKGKFWLKQKFIILETMKSATDQAMEKAGKRKTVKNKKGFVSMIKDAEVKKQYADMINKGIDNKAGKLKDEATDFFMEQKKRVIKKLEKAKSIKGSQKQKFKVSEIFSKSKEEDLSMSFIIPYITDYLKEAGMEALNMIAPQETFQDSERIQKLIQKRAEFFAESVNSTTLQKLDATLSEGIAASEGIVDLSDRVAAVYEEFPTYRSDMIARTEATAANNQGMIEGFKQSDVATGKEWIATMDETTRDSHAEINGEIVELDAQFSNGLEFPGDEFGDAGETINCRCVLGPAFVE